MKVSNHDIQGAGMNGVLPFLCIRCKHDIEHHHPIYDYGHKDRCLIKDCKCDGFTVLVRERNIYESK